METVVTTWGELQAAASGGAQVVWIAADIEIPTDAVREWAAPTADPSPTQESAESQVAQESDKSDGGKTSS
jgi:hypothetical protein